MYSLLKHISIPAFLLLLGLLLVPLALTAQPQRAYERGLEELQSGYTSRALDIWYMAYAQTEGVDSRIGFKYIEIVTKNRMREYYEQATELYYRALTDGTGTNSRIALRQEIERLRLIIGEGMYRQWIEWWEETSPALGTDIRGYWIQIDPTPAHLANERLIEHWERIAIARERFTRNSNTVYGTDDRAQIYIRYGEPDRTKSGILTIQSANIQQWLENQMTPPRDTRGEPPQRELDQDLMNPEVWQTQRLEDAIYEFHRYPEYEIWFYDRITPEHGETVPYIFGTDVQTGEFAYQNSVDDFIPERAFHPERERTEESLEFTRAGITPALMLQLLYYEQLTEADSFFETRLRDLREKVLQQGLQALQGMDVAFKAENHELMNRQAARAPRERSTYTGQLPQIPMNIYQYRFLDEEFEPYLITYIESSPQEAFMIDVHRNRGPLSPAMDVHDIHDLLTYYELNHTLQTYDESWNKTDKQQDSPPFFVYRGADDIPSRSLFRKPHTGRAFQSVSVELMNYDPDTRTVYETPFPTALRGLSNIQYRQPEPLHTFPDSLEMADLVLGYHKMGQATEPFSFWVANDQNIPYQETLVLHFQVYNLEQRYDGFTEFELTYRMFPVDEMGEILTDQTEFILTLNYISEDQRVAEDLEIETAGLQPGLYELRVHVEDVQSGQTKERSVRFEVEDVAARDRTRF